LTVATLTIGDVLVALSLVGFGLWMRQGKYVPPVLIPLLVHAVGVALVFAWAVVRVMPESGPFQGL